MARPIKVQLPQPACKFGYTRAQVETMMGVFLPRFDAWMRGQTAAICNGEECSVKHGPIIFQGDVGRFVEGLPIID